MKSNWRETPLSEAVSLVIDHRGLTPKKLGGDWSETGYRALSAKNVKTGRIVQEDAIRFVSEEMYHRWMPDEIERNDILITSEAPFGEILLWNSNEKIVLSQRLFGVRISKAFDPVFLYYYMLTDQFQGEMRARATGTTVIGLRQPELLKCRICYPEKEEQKKIATILRSLDDKIELNNRINENLEQQIEALYKSWFVEFEPFDGSAPLNWEKNDIYSIARIIYGAPFSSKLFNTEGNGLPIIRIRDLKDQTFVTYTTEQHPKAYLIKPGDIVVGMDGEFRPYLWGNSEALLNQRVCVFENLRVNGKAFLLCTLKPLLYRIEQTQVATTVIHIGKKDYDAFEVLLPDSNTLDKFDDITSPMIDLIVKNRLENKRLASARDILLPKLMSGELDVSEIDL